MEHRNCIICGNDKFTIRSVNALDTIYQGKCEKCGLFQITEEADNELQENRENEKNKIASYLYNRKIRNDVPVMIINLPLKGQNQLPTITLGEIINRFPQTINERLDLSLLNISQLSKSIGKFIKIEYSDYPAFYTDDNSHDGINFMLGFLYNSNYIEFEELAYSDFETHLLNEKYINLRLTPTGWSHISKLNQKVSSNSNVFVAMAFTDDMNKIYESAISPAITECGYKPIRVDKLEYNGKICDRIIYEIRQSRFIVSDFTDHRGGVYFEAGFAMGMDLPVIWTCREDQIDKTHFDTRQYNHIVWKDESELKERLKNRILATIN